MQAEHGVDLREMLVLLLVYLQVIERDILGLDETDYRADIFHAVHLYIDVHVARLSHDRVLDERQYTHAQEDQYESDYHALIKSRADGKSHAGRSPETRGGSQPLDLLPSGDDYRTRAEEADAVYDLCAETRGIRFHADGRSDLRPGVIDHIVQILAEYDRQRRAERDEHIRPESGGAAFPLALHADKTAHQQRENYAQHHGHYIKLSQIIQPVFQCFCRLP